MNLDNLNYKLLATMVEKEYRESLNQSKCDSIKHSIPQKLIEIDNFRKAKKSILEGNSSPIVKGYLAGDIENRIEEIKREITEMVGGY